MTHLDELVSATKSLDKAPPPQAGDRMWAKVTAQVAGGAAIGAAAATAATVGAKSASAATTAAATSSLAAGASTTAVASSSIALTLTKIGAAVALTAGIGVTVATVASSPEPQPVTSAQVQGPQRDDGEAPARRARSTQRPGAAEPDANDVEDVIEIVDEPASDEDTQTVAKPRPRKRSNTSKPAPASALAAESDLLGKARVAASAGRNRAALSAIRKHAARYPNGELAEVRRALEVQVLCNLKRPADARKAADRFLRRHRASALAGQVRSSCAYEE